MKKNKENDFPALLSGFLVDHLPSARNYSPNTVESYRTTFRILLEYLEAVKGKKRMRMRMEDLDRNTIMDFLSWLQSERKVSENTRNQRLAAIHSFFKYVAVEAPQHMATVQEVLTIPQVKSTRNLVPYLKADEVKRLLSQPDINTKDGRRDLALLSLCYDAALRVQELCDLRPVNLHMDNPAYIDILGKGRKHRPVPLMENTRKLLRGYLKENHLDRQWNLDRPLFQNRSGGFLSRSGVTYILQKYAAAAGIEINGKKITPHIMRHSKAVHLLNAGVDIYRVKDFLGHESIQTTEIYVELDMETKRKTLEDASREIVPETDSKDWTKDSDLMDFLLSL